jgi:hypothetical protein
MQPKMLATAIAAGEHADACASAIRISYILIVSSVSSVMLVSRPNLGPDRDRFLAVSVLVSCLSVLVSILSV